MTSTSEVVPSVGTSEDSNVMPVVEGIQEEVVEEEIVVKEEIDPTNSDIPKDSTSEVDEDIPSSSKDEPEKEVKHW